VVHLGRLLGGSGRGSGTIKRGLAAVQLTLAQLRAGITGRGALDHRQLRRKVGHGRRSKGDGRGGHYGIGDGALLRRLAAAVGAVGRRRGFGILGQTLLQTPQLLGRTVALRSLGTVAVRLQVILLHPALVQLALLLVLGQQLGGLVERRLREVERLGQQAGVELQGLEEILQGRGAHAGRPHRSQLVGQQGRAKRRTVQLGKGHAGSGRVGGRDGGRGCGRGRTILYKFGKNILHLTYVSKFVKHIPIEFS